MTDLAELRKYRTELPNLIDDSDLSVYAFRLYVHIKRVAGASGGSCHQGTRTLAQICKMSVGQVAKAKKELIAGGFVSHSTVKTNGGETDSLTPIDKWQENYDTYSKGVHTTNTTVQEVNTNEPETGKGVHTVNEGVHVVNTGVHTVNERKNQRRKNKEEERETRVPRGPPSDDIDYAHLAVVTYHSYFKRWPDIGDAKKIAALNPDFDKWSAICQLWKQSRWDYLKVDNLIDRYVKGNSSTNGRHKPEQERPALPVVKPVADRPDQRTSMKALAEEARKRHDRTT